MADENKNTDGAPLSRIKTYEDAVKEALQTQSMSSASMLMAEQKKRENFRSEDESESIKNPKNLLFMILSIVFIVGALGLLAFSLISNGKNQNNETKIILKSKYFEAEQIIELPSAQLSRNTLSKIQQVFNEPYQIGQIVQIIITKEIKADPNSVFEIKKKVSYDTNDILALIESRAPESVRKSLDSEFMLGVHKSSKNEPFLLIRTTNFEKVFAGMFEWEAVLAKDMVNIFTKEIELVKNTAPQIPQTPIDTKTSTSTNSTSTESQINIPQRTIDNTRVWHDKVLSNNDTRALLGANGEILFFYTFIDNEYLFFGTKEETFDEVRRRLRNAKLVL